MNQNLKALVSISCITYNQAFFIRDCIDGFVNQKTEFKYEILIHDDCSTDGTDAIIKEYAEKYPDLIKPVFEEENQYSKGKPIGSSVWNVPRAEGKYIALCEGDDYWIDSNKLQKQVDFLENHPEYSMCFHNAWNQFDRNPQLTELFSNIEDREYTSSEILLKWIIPTGSVVFRKDVVNGSFYRDVVLPKRFMYSDTPLFLTCARCGKVMGFSDIMSVYRRHEGGISRGFSVESYDRLADYSMKLGEVFDMERIGRTISCKAFFDGFCLSLKNKKVKCSMLMKALKRSPIDVCLFIRERLNNAIMKK